MRVVKLNGNIEDYDSEKVFSSIFKAALNCHYPHDDAHKVAKSVKRKVNNWMQNQDHVTTFDIRDKILSNVSDPDISLMYLFHDEIC